MMHAAVVLALILMQAGGPGVQPPKQAPEPAPVKPEERCTITGVVTNARTGEPVRKANVTAMRILENRPPASAAAMTDAAGRYTISNLEPGKYFVSATRTGYSGGHHGQKPRGSNMFGQMAGTQLTLDTGQVLKDINISMLPQGVVTGRVTDEDNEAIANVGVQLQRWTYMDGRKRLVPAGMAGTDDRGHFRIFGIAPGRYLLSATYRPQQWGPSPAQQDDANAYYATTFYPGGLSPAEGATIEVAAGSDISGIDLRLLKARTYKVAGKVAGVPTGRPAWLGMFPRGDSTGMPWDQAGNTLTEPDGSFVFRGIRPGRYMIQAHAQQQEGPPQTAAGIVDVTGADVEGVQLSFAGSEEITGAVQVEGANDLKSVGKESQVYVLLSPEDGAFGPGGAGTDMKADGRFAITPTVPDRYRVRVNGLPPGYYLKSVRFGREELTDNLLDMSSGVIGGEMTVIVSPNAGEISGTVKNDGKAAGGATAVLVPTDGGRRESHRVAQTDQNGSFTIKSVPPGTYKLYAFDHVEWGATEDAEFMKPHEPRGVDVVVKEKETVTKDATLIVTEEESQGSGTNR